MRACALFVALFVASIGFVRADLAIPPTPDHYVTDNAAALSSTMRTALESELRTYEQQSGHQVIVWIGQTTGEVPLEDWTSEAGHRWKIGHKGKDDGVILFWFMKDHKVRIEVGYGAEGKLPDATAKQIVDDDIVPKMKAGDVDDAVRAGVESVIAVLSPGYAGPTAAPSQSSDSGSQDVIAGLVFLGIFLVVGGGLLFALIVTIVRRGKRHHDWLDAFMFSGGVSSGGYMGSGGSWSSGGGGFSGGGFSAGGGDFGGGGASGSW